MRDKKFISVMWSIALVVGLVLGAGAQDSRADQAGGKAKAGAKKEGRAASKPETKGGGKAGDACKVDDDCDSSSRPMTCQKAGDASKCVAVPIHPAT